jgi:hypothetical protein
MISHYFGKIFWMVMISSLFPVFSRGNPKIFGFGSQGEFFLIWDFA